MGGWAIILHTYAGGGEVNEKHAGAYKRGGGPKLAILLRRYFMDAPLGKILTILVCTTKMI